MREDSQDIKGSSNILKVPYWNKMGEFVIFYDAAFSSRDGKSAYDVDIYFDNSLIVAGAVKGKICFSSKESEASAIFYGLRRARELERKK